jgi:hypothetical protein
LTKDKQKILEEEESRLKNILTSAVGENTYALVPGFHKRFSYASQSRTGNLKVDINLAVLLDKYRIPYTRTESSVTRVARLVK